MGQNCCTGKNQVKNQLIISDNVVKKQFHSKIAWDKEKELLSLLAGSGLCPHIISACDNAIEMSCISGVTVSQALKKETASYIFEKLADWIIRFNKLTKDIVLDDINLKNFIWNEKENSIYGIDFERWHKGDNTQNLAAIMAVISAARYEDLSVGENLYSNIYRYITEKTESNLFVEIEKRKITVRRKAMPLIRKSDCVIIAGGKSSRMGYPKGLLDLNGYAFTDHIIYNTSVFDRQCISANTDLYSGFGCDIIPDIFKDIGPMGALHSALNHCYSEYVFFIPCDMPFVSEETIFHLYNNLSDSCDAAVFSDGDRIFPTVGIYRKTALPFIEKQIKTGNYRLRELLCSLKTQYIPAPYPKQFKNINTPQDYQNI